MTGDDIYYFTQMRANGVETKRMARNNLIKREWLGLGYIRVQALTSCAIPLEFLVIIFLAGITNKY